MSDELKSHWDKGHEVIEDMFVYDNCEERVFYCKDCNKILICTDDGTEIKLREELPGGTPNKEISKHLHFLEF